MALPDNQHALSGSADKTIKLFNVNDGAVRAQLHAPHKRGDVPGAQMLPDGLRFVVARPHNTARITDHGLAP